MIQQTPQPSSGHHRTWAKMHADRLRIKAYVMRYGPSTSREVAESLGLARVTTLHDMIKMGLTMSQQEVVEVKEHGFGYCHGGVLDPWTAPVDVLIVD